MSTYDYYEKQLDPTPRVRTMSGPFGDEPLKSIADAVAYCERKGLDPAKVRLAHNYVIWDQPETPAEVEARLANATASRDKHLAAIAAMHADYVSRGLIPATTHRPETTTDAREANPHG